MPGWERHFKLLCNKFVLPGIGTIDAGNPQLTEEKLLQAYHKKCRYVLLTPEGHKHYFPGTRAIEPEPIQPEPAQKPKRGKPKT